MTLLTKKEVAAYLKCSVRHVEYLMNEERISHIYLSAKMVRFKQEDVDAYIENSRTVKAYKPPPLYKRLIGMT